MIREATPDDMAELMAMLAHLQASSGSLGKFDEDTAKHAVTKLMEADESVIFRSERGLIAGFTMTPWKTHNWLMAVEMWWWAEDGQWMPLLRKFEEWAIERGAGEVRMASTIDPVAARLAKVFRRAGYEPRELCYRKVI